MLPVLLERYNFIPNTATRQGKYDVNFSLITQRTFSEEFKSAISSIQASTQLH